MKSITGHSAESILAAATDLAVSRINAELSLIESVVCDHVRGVPIALAAGIKTEHFSEDDAKLIWSACHVCAVANTSQEKLIRVTTLALQADGFWNPKGPIGPPFPQLWSIENLSRLAKREYHSGPVIRRNASHLIDLCRRQETASQHLRDAMAAMTYTLQMNVGAAA